MKRVRFISFMCSPETKILKRFCDFSHVSFLLELESIKYVHRVFPDSCQNDPMIFRPKRPLDQTNSFLTNFKFSIHYIPPLIKYRKYLKNILGENELFTPCSVTNWKNVSALHQLLVFVCLFCFVLLFCFLFLLSLLLFFFFFFFFFFGKLHRETIY